MYYKLMFYDKKIMSLTNVDLMEEARNLIYWVSVLRKGNQQDTVVNNNIELMNAKLIILEEEITTRMQLNLNYC